MKQNTSLIILVVVLGMVTAWFLFNRDTGTLKKELSDFAVKDTAKIDKIFLADKLGKSSLLERKSAGEWVVNGNYTVRQDAMTALLTTLKVMTVKSPVSESMFETVIKEMSSSVQKKCEVYIEGKLVKTMYLGTETMDKMGTFMLLEGSSVPFEVHVPGHRGFIQTRFITDERLWRDPYVFKMDYRTIREVNVAYRDKPESGFRLTFDGNKDIQLFQGEKLIPALQIDTSKAITYLAEISKINYEFVVTESFDAKRDSILQTKPFAEVRIKDANNQIQEIACFHRSTPDDALDLDPRGVAHDPDRMYGWLNKKDFLLVQFYQFNRAIKPIEWFLK